MPVSRVRADVAPPAYQRERPSAHCAWSEWRCHDGVWLPLAYEERAIVTAHEFELVRAAAGGWPITILSAYRTPEHNHCIGGAPKSQHVEGRALDLKCPANIADVRDFWAIAKRIAQEPESKIRGLGYYATFVHIDTRPSARLVEWYGSLPVRAGCDDL